MKLDELRELRGALERCEHFLAQFDAEEGSVWVEEDQVHFTTPGDTALYAVFDELLADSRAALASLAELGER